MPTAKPTFNSIDEYISSFSPDVQTSLQTLRQTIKAVAPEAAEAIKYGMPTFTLYGNLIYFAAWKKHISLYPLTAQMEATLPEIAAYKTSGKGTIQFPLDKPLPLSLIRQIVQIRVDENTANKDK